MSKEIFISYSRRDQEFVTRLASDLNAQVAGVWFDQSAIQLGENWHDAIMEGIHECKAFVLVLSLDADESKYVREEVNKALELGKTIFPILYRYGEWTGEFESLVEEIQTLDLRSGSYTDNFQKLVDGLIEAGAGKVTGYERPFLRGQTKIGLNVVFSKVPGWAFAWSLGWLVLSLIIFIVIFAISAAQGYTGLGVVLNLFIFLVIGATSGFVGGLVAGLFTMLALRPYAPSISWKHMSPTIRIWGIGVVSGLITIVILTIGAISVQGTQPDCRGLGFKECVGQVFGEFLRIPLVTAVVLVFLIPVAWFLTGMFAGWQAVRHIRTLEPGITNGQSRGVSLGWGCGTVVAAIVLIAVMNILGL